MHLLLLFLLQLKLLLNESKSRRCHSTFTFQLSSEMASLGISPRHIFMANFQSGQLVGRQKKEKERKQVFPQTQPHSNVLMPESGRAGSERRQVVAVDVGGSWSLYNSIHAWLSFMFHSIGWYRPHAECLLAYLAYNYIYFDAIFANCFSFRNFPRLCGSFTWHTIIWALKKCQ